MVKSFPSIYTGLDSIMTTTKEKKEEEQGKEGGREGSNKGDKEKKEGGMGKGSLIPYPVCICWYMLTADS